MTDFREIYARRAWDYERLVAREDYQRNLIVALERARALAELDVVELGAGTGRLTRLLAPRVRSIAAFDAAPAMLAVACQRLSEDGARNWRLGVADNSALPVANSSADLTVAGWSLGHSVGWFPDRWREVVGAALAEMRRVLRPGGAAIILETLGTGRTLPQPPTDGLRAYYRWLEEEHGFLWTWTRTDYRFISVHEADELTRFFFGADLADRVRQERLTIVPECTGLWRRVYA